MQLKRILLRGLLLVSLSTASANAALLGSFEFSGSGGVARVIVDFVPFVQFSPTEVATGYRLFDSFVLGDADIGQTFSIASNSDDPDFSAVVGLLTNGENNWIEVGIIGPSLGSLENILFGFLSNSPDFFGSLISRIDLTLGAWTHESPGKNPNGNGTWTDYSVGYTVSVYGEPLSVPEPATLALFGLGLAGLGAVRRKILAA